MHTECEDEVCGVLGMSVSSTNMRLNPHTGMGRIVVRAGHAAGRVSGGGQAGAGVTRSRIKFMWGVALAGAPPSTVKKSTQCTVFT